MTLENICVPGQRLCLAQSKYIPGNGTFEHKGYIYATLAGIVTLIPKEKSLIVEVKTDKGSSIGIDPGDIVIAQITHITQRFARCSIKCVRDVLLPRAFRGIIRKEDMHATEKDKTMVHKCFRPGDIIVARVLPMNELQSFPLSTAEEELGVVIANSETGGVPMIPISWTEMQCPKTYNKEDRKVARVIPESITID